MCSRTTGARCRRWTLRHPAKAVCPDDKQTFRTVFGARAYEAKRGTLPYSTPACLVVAPAEIAGGSITDRRIPNGVAEQGPAFGNTAASRLTSIVDQRKLGGLKSCK